MAGPDLCFRKPSPGRENGLELQPTGREEGMRPRDALEKRWAGLFLPQKCFCTLLPFHSG